MSLTKQQRELLAIEIRQFLLENDIWQDVTIYFNGKAFSTYDGNGRYAYNDPNTLFVLEDRDPSNYFDYVAKPHILSMSFEGPFCGCLNYYNEYGADFDNRVIKGFLAILNRYGLYYELGDHWNLSCYPIHDSKQNAERGNEDKEPIRFWGERTIPEGKVIPKPILHIQRAWKEKSDAYGDVGSCVTSAGFRFTYIGHEYFMYPNSCWQGSVSWEHCIKEIEAMLTEVGAEQIQFIYGVMD